MGLIVLDYPRAYTHPAPVPGAGLLDFNRRGLPMNADAVRAVIRILNIALLSCLPLTAAHSQALPEGRGLDVVAMVCTQCHGLDYLAGAAGVLTAEDWENALYDMIARGAPVEEKDLDIVLNYLVDNLARR